MSFPPPDSPSPGGRPQPWAVPPYPPIHYPPPPTDAPNSHPPSSPDASAFAAMQHAQWHAAAASHIGPSGSPQMYWPQPMFAPGHPGILPMYMPPGARPVTPPLAAPLGQSNSPKRGRKRKAGEPAPGARPNKRGGALALGGRAAPVARSAAAARASSAALPARPGAPSVPGAQAAVAVEPLVDAPAVGVGPPGPVPAREQPAAPIPAVAVPGISAGERERARGPDGKTKLATDVWYFVIPTESKERPPEDVQNSEPKMEMPKSKWMICRFCWSVFLCPQIY
jgi:hypothetical protein